jgi:folylpolyglutamate synthase
VGASSFELLTLTALLVFEEAEVDIVVIEVGMGGRLDATNVILDQYILVSALTAVDLDHQAFLGNNVEDIATEKAAIARSGKPFILGKQKHHTVTETVQKLVKDDVLVHAQVAVKREWDESLDGPKPQQFSFSPADLQAFLSQRVEIKSLPPFLKPIFATLPLYGEHQLENLEIAVSMISALLTHPSCTGKLPPDIHVRITPETIARGIQSTKWPGRLAFHTITLPETLSDQPGRSLTVLADGAHNPASSASLGNFIGSLLDLRATRSETRSTLISLTYILALSHSPPKKPRDTISPLFSHSILSHQHSSSERVKMNVAVVRFTPPDGMPWVKSVSPSELRRTVLDVAPGLSIWAADDDISTENQLSDALVWAGVKHEHGMGENGNGLVVVAGSLYLVADLYRFMNSQ